MKQPPIHFRRCPECDANNDAVAAHCWLCGRPLTAKDEVILAELVPARAEKGLELLLAVLTIAAAALSLLLIVGAAQIEPAIAMYAAIGVGPAFLATAIRAAGRRALGKPFTWQNTLVTFFVSITVVLSIFGLLVTAFAILLFIVCLRAFSHSPL